MMGLRMALMLRRVRGGEHYHPEPAGSEEAFQRFPGGIGQGPILLGGNNLFQGTDCPGAPQFTGEDHGGVTEGWIPVIQQVHQGRGTAFPDGIHPGLCMVEVTELFEYQ